MQTYLSNEIAMVIIVVLVAALVGIIYFLLAQKRFHIRNVDIELEEFLNLLYSESTKSNLQTKDVVHKFISHLKAYEEKHDNTTQGLNKFVEHILGEIQGVKEHIASIQELALQKEQKIRRYEEGYDQVIIKNFTKGLFRILETIKEEQVKGNSNSLSEIQEDILILLENNGVDKIDIELGSDYKNYTKVAKIIGTEVTADPKKDGKVKEIKRDGYLIQVDETTTKVLIPSEIIVYKLSTGVVDV